MPISPRFVGDLLPVYVFTFTDDSNRIVDISGQSMNNFTFVAIPNPKVAQANLKRIAGAGVFSYVTNGTDGQIIYTPVAADVTQAGSFLCTVVALIGGTKPMTADLQPLVFNPAP